MDARRILQQAGFCVAVVFLAGLFLAPLVSAAPAIKPALAPAAKAAPAVSPMTPAVADVIVKRIGIVPAQPVAGESFEVHVELFNQGRGPTGPGQQCVLGIEPGGGPAGPFPVPAVIAPGQSYDFVKKYVFMQAGNYAALARPIPGPGDATIKTFVVAAKSTGITPSAVGGQTTTGSKLLSPVQEGAAKVAPQPLKPVLTPPDASAQPPK